MLILAKICEALLPLAYTSAAWSYGLAFFRREEVFQRWTRPTLVSALAIHTILIYAWTAYRGHCLVYTPFELMTLIGFTIVLTYLVVEIATKERGTGLFFVGLALILQTLSVMFSPSIESTETSPHLLNDIVGLHISAALFGYTAFAISAVYGALYLMLYHQIKSNRFGTFYERLPSLQRLEVMGEKAAWIGVGFLTVSVGIALLFMPDSVPDFSYADPKLIATYAIWGVYAAGLLARRFVRLEGRKIMILSVVGFLGTLLSMTVINFLLSGFHGFS